MKRSTKVKNKYNGITVISKDQNDYEQFDRDIVDYLFNCNYIDEDTKNVDFSKSDEYIIIDNTKYELIGDRLYYCED